MKNAICPPRASMCASSWSTIFFQRRERGILSWKQYLFFFAFSIPEMSHTFNGSQDHHWGTCTSDGDGTLQSCRESRYHDSAQALSHIRVLDHSRILAGQYGFLRESSDWNAFFELKDEVDESLFSSFHHHNSETSGSTFIRIDSSLRLRNLVLKNRLPISLRETF